MTVVIIIITITIIVVTLTTLVNYIISITVIAAGNFFIGATALSGQGPPHSGGF